MNMALLNIAQYGTDGFGHQFEGLLRLISCSLNRKANYDYNFRKKTTYEHSNFTVEELNNYINNGLQILSQITNTNHIHNNYENVCIIQHDVKFEDIMQKDNNYKNNIYLFDGVGDGSRLAGCYEPMHEMIHSLPILRKAFVENNIYLPKPTYINSSENIIVAHIRLNDAVGTRPLQTDKLFELIKFFQTNGRNYKLIIHSDGDVSHLQHENTIIYDKSTNVLQVLSDFIYADILLMNYSALSIAAHILGKDEQTVICPSIAGPTFIHRILSKCVNIDVFMNIYKPLQ